MQNRSKTNSAYAPEKSFNNPRKHGCAATSPSVPPNSPAENAGALQLPPQFLQTVRLKMRVRVAELVPRQHSLLHGRDSRKLGLQLDPETAGVVALGERADVRDARAGEMRRRIEKRAGGLLVGGLEKGRGRVGGVSGRLIPNCGWFFLVLRNCEGSLCGVVCWTW